MNKKIKWITIIIISLLFSSILLTITYFKQSRILLPQWYGLYCIDDHICLEDIESRSEAEALYANALQLITTNFSLLEQKPRALFCSTEQCSRRFGLYKANAQAIGSLGVIISHRGWQQHLVNHEFIHYWQVSILGEYRMSQQEPWLIEGMAYALSDDPRVSLSEPFEGYKNRFRIWCTDACRNNIQRYFLTVVQ